MILANVAAAETLERGARAADLSRARRAGRWSGSNALREFLQTLDISLPKGGALRPSSSTASSRG